MSYYRWPVNQGSILLHLNLVNEDGTGATGKSPQVVIQRASDGRYWDGNSFEVAVTQLAMTEVSASNLPGYYEFDFEQPEVAATYRVFYRHTAAPVGVDAETHEVTGVSDPTTGAREITFNLRDQADAPVPYGRVDVFDSTDTNLLVSVADSDGDGSIVMHLDDGTYQVRAIALRFTLDTIPTPIVVSADAEHDLDGTLTTPAASADPDLCTVTGTLRSADGVAVADVNVDFYADGPQGIDADLFVRSRVRVTSDIAGLIEVDLVRGSSVKIVCSLANLDGLIIEVPDAGSADLADLVEAAS